MHFRLRQRDVLRPSDVYWAGLLDPPCRLLCSGFGSVLCIQRSSHVQLRHDFPYSPPPRWRQHRRGSGARCAGWHPLRRALATCPAACSQQPVLDHQKVSHAEDATYIWSGDFRVVCNPLSHCRSPTRLCTCNALFFRRSCWHMVWTAQKETASIIISDVARTCVRPK